MWELTNQFRSASMERASIMNVGVSPETLAWVAERRRPGNWFSIGPNDEIPQDFEGWEGTIFHMFQLAFSPEIEARIADGRLDTSFELHTAQLIIPLEAPRIVRLNNEVRGLPLVKLDRALKKGESITRSDLENLINFDLQEEELDCGHFTMFWTGLSWIAFFDARSGRAKAFDMISTARQFLASSIYSADNDHAAAVDTLFSACELLSKAHLILYRNPAVKAKTHKPVSSALNMWGKVGNVNGEFVRVFNRMSDRRSNARYDAGSKPTAPSPEDFAIVSAELSALERAVAHRNPSNNFGMLREPE